MKTTYLFLLLLMLLYVSDAFSQAQRSEGTLSGYVLDKKSEERLPAVTVFVKGTTRGTSSRSDGTFEVKNIPEGKQVVVAQYVGYKPQEININIAAGKDHPIHFELEEDMFNLEQVVVTGTRTPHFVKNVPIRTEVVTSQSLRTKNAQNIFEALEAVPGLRVENQCQSCNFSMVRMQGLGAEHTQVQINGQPIYSGLASVYGLEQIGTGDVDRIEVVKGAGSALYGSSAVAGAINIITREPSAIPSISADVQFGNYATNAYNISSSMRNDKGNIGLNVYAQKVDHGVIDETGEGDTRQEVKQKDGVTDRVESKLHNMGFSLYVDNPFFRDDKLVLRGKGINEKRAGGVITDDYYKNPFTDGTENITTNRYEGEVNYTKPVGQRSGLQFNTTYIDHNREATNDSFLSDYKDTHDGETPDVLDMRPYIAKENTWVSSLSFNSKLENHNLIFGVQYYTTDLDETGMYTVVDEASEFYGNAYKSIAHKHAREIGAYIQDEWNVSPRFTVVPGVRIDHHSSGEEYTSDRKVFDDDFPKTEFDETSFNPRLALKYQLTRKITLRANAGTGFRAPYGFSEDLHLCSGSPRVWKSSELKAETSRSANFSADYYGDHFQASANLFYTYLKNKIDFADADDGVKKLGYTYQWENIDNAVVKGMELMVVVNPARNLNVGVDFALNSGKYKNNRGDWTETEYANISRYIPRFPTTTGSIKLEYSPKSWMFTLYGIYQGRMYIDYISETAGNSRIKETDPYMTFNARVSRRFGLFNLYAGAKNIFNYVQDEKHLDDAAFIYAPLYGALYYAGISVNINY
ncbi:MAG: TonB-dependent receptor [Proteiniphilum sp.]|uniref:TonB-dependent receptor n=1 Tax=Proteiniphilum sp. TaxID=1926877 RepID=UPI002B1F5E7C|nr:TonB-dependent receptor [Proteiniphilum sp.]MEA5127504.1 TonB-dependent receptor [Proteiniphilum sp.]